MSTQLQDREVVYVPLGEKAEVRLSVSTAKRFIACKTRTGREPSDVDVVKFLMLCRARLLNPWVGDAYLVGYDGKDGPVYSLITAFQAVLKRAELNDQYDGLEGGVIVAVKGGEPIERPGELLRPGEDLVGAWARAYRKDRRVAAYVSINRKSYDTGRSQWEKDPAGMLVKCAKAKALRETFPTEVGGMYVEGEEKPASDPPQPRPKVRDAFVPPPESVVEEPQDDTRSMVACVDCGHMTPPDMVDDGRCPECFRRAERPE